VKRDMDLIREILLRVEEHEHGFAPQELGIPGYDAETVGFHCYLLDEAGLLRATETTHRGSDSPCAAPQRLTWAGYEFLDAARSESLWQQARRKVGETIETCAFGTLQALLLYLARQQMGLPG